MYNIFKSKLHPILPLCDVTCGMVAELHVKGSDEGHQKAAHGEDSSRVAPVHRTHIHITVGHLERCKFN